MEKNKCRSRTLDGDGFRRRAACICFRKADPHHSLLVSSSRSADRWVVPGGGVEAHETEAIAAIRELEEEAGLKGEVICSLGVFYEKQSRTEVFIVRVLDELASWSEDRQRRWMSLEEMFHELQNNKPAQCEYVRKFIDSQIVID